MDISTAPIRIMEPAIVERLRLGFPAKDFAIERVPQVLTLTEFGRIARLSPFIGLAWTGFAPDGQTNARTTKGDMRWRLILVFKASNGLETRFKGDTRGLGLDAMVDVAILLLNGAVFDDIGTCQVTSAESVIADGWTDGDLVIAQIDLTVKFSATPRILKLITADDFAQLGITWIIEPAVDGAPEVTDTVEPPQPED